MGLISIGAQSASAATITLDSCTGAPGQCQAFGGHVTIDVTLLGSDLVLQATNSLTSGAVTQLGFNFAPLNIDGNYGVTVVSSSSSGGNGVSFSNLSSLDAMGSFVIDLGIKGLDGSGNAGSWAPGESIFVRLNTNPDLTAGLLANFEGFAQIQGACKPDNKKCVAGSVGGQHNFQLQGVGGSGEDDQTAVPEPATLLMLGGGLAAMSLRRRFKRT